jgi:hypothetical protein
MPEMDCDCVHPSRYALLVSDRVNMENELKHASLLSHLIALCERTNSQLVASNVGAFLLTITRTSYSFCSPARLRDDLAVLIVRQSVLFDCQLPECSLKPPYDCGVLRGHEPFEVTWG